MMTLRKEGTIHSLPLIVQEFTPMGIERLFRSSLIGGNPLLRVTPNAYYSLLFISSPHTMETVGEGYLISEHCSRSQSCSGSIFCHFHMCQTSTEEINRWIIIQMWKSSEYLKAHLSSTTYAAFLNAWRSLGGTVVFEKVVVDRADGLQCMSNRSRPVQVNAGGSKGDIHRVCGLTVTRAESTTRLRQLASRNMVECRNHPACIYSSLGQVVDEVGTPSNEWFLLWIFADEAGYRDFRHSSTSEDYLNEISEHIITLDYYSPKYVRQSNYDHSSLYNIWGGL